MFELNFSDTKQCIHFIGIGGISMSGLAELLLSKGFMVSGSDSKESELTDRLSTLGARICYGQKAENITDNITVVVMTAAIHPDNPELLAAQAQGIPVITRAEFLGQVMRQYEIPAAVAGTHGKTTTTSMISEMLMAANCNPTLSIGGILPSIGGNFRVGGDKYFVTEACEYTNSFLSFFPGIEIILNIDADHLDFFKDIDDIRNSFKAFTRLLPEDGTLIINGDIEKLSYITDGLLAKVITFGLGKDCDYSASDITYDEYARPSFTLIRNGQPSGNFSLGVTGEHNVCNALSAIAFGQLIGISDEIIAASLKTFTGTNRRFQVKGVCNGFTILDDYAHHPTEIKATLTAAANYPHNKLWCIFQPHTYTRTKALIDEFAQALSLSDNIILADIYAARETDTLGISSETLADQIRPLNKNVWYIPTFDEIKVFVKNNLSTGDLLITMGAGNVVNIGEELLRE